MRTPIFASAILFAGYALLSSVSCSSSSTPSGSGGSTGSGGTAGSAMGCTDSLQSLGFDSACNACITKSCLDDFQTCEANADCSCELKCVSKCYLSTGNLTTCAMTTCMDTTDAGHSAAHDIVFCVLDMCGAADQCMVAAK